MDSTPTARVYKTLGILIILGFCTTPNLVFAEITITEIMYDAPGNDTGHEWLEIENKGTDSIDASNYKVFESGINHKLTVIQGSGSMAPGAIAITTQDPAKFAGDFPHYSGAIFKVSLDLSNTGEEISLKNASSSAVDTISYSSGMGAAGDGSTLHKIAVSFKAGKPDPGVVGAAIEAIPRPVSVIPEKTTTKKVSQSRIEDKKVSTDSKSTTSVRAAAPDIASVRTPLPPENSPWLMEGVLGLIAFVTLGVASVYYSRSMTAEIPEETSPTPEEFDIEG